MVTSTRTDLRQRPSTLSPERNPGGLQTHHIESFPLPVHNGMVTGGESSTAIDISVFVQTKDMHMYIYMSTLW